MALIDITKGAPANKTAALVTSRSRVEFDGTAHIDPTRLHSETPLPLRMPAAGFRPEDNLTGRKMGRLTAIGLLDRAALGLNRKTRCKRGASWVVRCVCGKYETRTKRAFGNPKNKEDRCEACWKVARMQKCRAYRDGLTDRQAWEF